MPSSIDNVLKYNENLPKVMSTHAVHLFLFNSFKRRVFKPSQLLGHCNVSHKSAVMGGLAGILLVCDLYSDPLKRQY